MKVALASDHAGYRMKSFLAKALAEEGYEVLDLGCESEEAVDYPRYGKSMADALAREETPRGILICGSGIGMSMAANRFAHVRAGVANDPLSARLAREHNDANVLCLGGQLIGNWQALECAKVFLATEYAGGRHQPRVAMLAKLGSA
jgi:ribose 5-phosphate isomerase B